MLSATLRSRHSDSQFAPRSQDRSQFSEMSRDSPSRMSSSAFTATVLASMSKGCRNVAVSVPSFLGLLQHSLGCFFGGKWRRSGLWVGGLAACEHDQPQGTLAFACR